MAAFSSLMLTTFGVVLGLCGQAFITYVWALADNERKLSDFEHFVGLAAAILFFLLLPGSDKSPHASY